MWSNLVHETRRRSIPVMIDDIIIGGDAPIVVQAMTNTATADIETTVRQTVELADAGARLVRITVNNELAAAAVGAIRRRLDALRCPVPLVGDFHYNGHHLLTAFPDCAAALAKYRINPGNVGRGRKRDDQFSQMIAVAKKYNKPVRIGVNWGSLDPALLAELMDANGHAEVPLSTRQVQRQALVRSAIDSAQQAEALGLGHDRIIISCKVSDVPELIMVYRELARACDYALHLGLTEAGMGVKGMVSSTAALAILLHEGIGDTIRVSLTPEPEAPRTMEVRVAQEILQSLDMGSFMPQVIACPGCGRTTSTYFQHLASDIQTYLQTNMPLWKRRYPGVETMQVAVMGCVVNGPGESRHANIGISLPGTGEQPVAPVFEDGQKTATLRGDNIAAQFQQLLEAYVERTYGSNATG